MYRIFSLLPSLAEYFEVLIELPMMFLLYVRRPEIRGVPRPL